MLAFFIYYYFSDPLNKRQDFHSMGVTYFIMILFIEKKNKNITLKGNKYLEIIAEENFF